MSFHLCSSTKMARSANNPENMIDLLSCVVCMEDFEEETRIPKLLMCHHTLCAQCIGRLARGTTHVDCPTCRQRTTLTFPPPEGVSNLQTNFYLAQMKSLLPVGGVAGQSSKTCQRHRNSALTLYCESCETIICEECANTSHSASVGHITKKLALAMKEQTQLMNTEVAVAQELLLKREASLKNYKSEVSNLTSAHQQAKDEIDTAFEHYISLVNARKEDLHASLDQLYNERKDILNDKTEKLGKHINLLSTSVEQCTNASRNGTVSDILAYRSKISSQNVEVRAESNSIQQDPGQNYIHFQDGNGKNELQDVLQGIGVLTISGYLPSVVKITEVNAIATNISSAVFKVTDFSGNNLNHFRLEAEILDPEGDNVSCLLKVTHSGFYEIIFRPCIQGNHSLRVKFGGRCIEGADFMLEVKSNNPVAILGHTGNEIIHMEYPRAVALDSHNNVFVVDSGNMRIQKFNSNDQFLHQFPLSSEAESYSSCGLAINCKDGLLLFPEVCMQGADLTDANTVLVYSMTGQLVNRFMYRELLKRALSIAVNSRGRIIVADYDLNEVFIFGPDGTFLKKFGKRGSRAGHFQHPTFVCVGKDDSIIVSDGENDRIQVFDKGGKFIRQIGRRGKGKGQLDMPFGVASDCFGNILVVDGGNKRVQIFDQNGEYSGTIDSKDSPLNAPRGIAVTNDGHVYIVDRDNHCVKKYKYLNSHVV